MRMTDTLQRWLLEQGWDTPPEIDAKEETSVTRFGVTINDIHLDCLFEIAATGNLPRQQTLDLRRRWFAREVLPAVKRF